MSTPAHSHVRRAGTVSALALAGAALLSGAPAMAENFYAGKTLHVLIGAGAGGGYDRYGRSVGRYIARHLPGSPNMVPRNMPGAASMRAAEYLFSIAPKDGTMIAILQPGSLFEPLINTRLEVRYRAEEFKMIGNVNSGALVCVMHHTSKVKTFEDAQKIPANMGGNAPGTSTTDYAQLLNSLAGAKFNIINGYDSTSRVVLAMERGELDGVCGFDSASFASQRPDWYGTDQTNMIVQVGMTPLPELEKLGAPSVWNYLSGRNRDVARLIISQQELLRPFVAPPQTPDDRVAMLREAFNKTMEDPEFLAEAKKSKLDVSPKPGSFIEDLVREIYASPEDLIAEARKALGR